MSKTYKLIIFSILLLSVISLDLRRKLLLEDPQVVSKWQHFLIKSKKIFTHKSDAEHLYRFNVFKENLKQAQWAQANDQGTAKYGVTKFMDLT